MNIRIYSEKLARYGKKTITKAQLEKLFAETDDEALFSIVTALEQESLLAPFDRSPTNGNRIYPIHLKYHVTIPVDSFDTEQEEIRRLHPLLQSSGVLQEKPAEYRKYRDRLLMVDRYLFEHGTDRIPISRKERSFEIFGEEKVLDESTFSKFLEKLGLGKEKLAFYDTPEYCFNDYIPMRKPQMTLLICENKDIWFNIRRRMFEDGAGNIFDTHIDGVVLGWGNQVTQKNALTAYTAFLGGGRVSYLYWGDIDRAGLNIYLGLQSANPQLDISLFVPAYEAMLDRAKKVRIPDSTDLREVMKDYSDIYVVISEKNRDFLKENILGNKRIPQEIITYETLLQNMR